MALLITLLALAHGNAQEAPAPRAQDAPLRPASTESDPSDVASEISPSREAVATRPLRRHALLIVGLPGDEPHRVTFQQTVDTWRQWLTEVAGVDGQDITVLSALAAADESQTVLPPTSQQLRDTIGRLRESIGRQDGLWVFLLGHGSQDQRQGFFHLPGPDLSATQWAGLFADSRAAEQVFWLTHAGSGSFVKPMSLPGRIVIAATDADGEVNETKFPHLLAEIMHDQLDTSDDESKSDSPSNVLELFRAVAESVNESFELEQLVPTEHAQLDDNGDGIGSELGDLSPPTAAPIDSQPPEPAQPLVDGVGAMRTAIRLRPPGDELTPAATDNVPLPSLPDQASE